MHSIATAAAAPPLPNDTIGADCNMQHTTQPISLFLSQPLLPALIVAIAAAAKKSKKKEEKLQRKRTALFAAATPSTAKKRRISMHVQTATHPFRKMTSPWTKLD